MTAAPPIRDPELRRSLPARLGLLLALLLATLQAGMPFAHAMQHVSLRAAVAAGCTQHQPSDAPAWSSTVADETPCALCAADHLPALPEARALPIAVTVSDTTSACLRCRARSSAPLDVFCRPPPKA